MTETEWIRLAQLPKYADMVGRSDEAKVRIQQIEAEGGES